MTLLIQMSKCRMCQTYFYPKDEAQYKDQRCNVCSCNMVMDVIQDCSPITDLIPIEDTYNYDR